MLRARYYFKHVDSLGQKVRVLGKPAIHNWGEMHIGERATIATTELVADDGTLEIGNRTYINYGCSISASQLVCIGPDYNIGTYAIILDNDLHSLEPERRNERPEPAPIILEENVWLGGRVIVLRA